jgi:adenylosuccinate synthase
MSDLPADHGSSEPRPSDHLARPAPRLTAAITGRGVAVVGLQWGDEGKGKVIDAIAPRFQAVVRYNGGANAGHSIVFGGKRHSVHLIPSGVFNKGSRPVIANGVVIDPFTLVREIDALAGAGADLTRLSISDRAHLVMPYHQAEDASREVMLDDPAKQGPSKPTSGAIGTTRRGIGPAYAEKAARSTAIRAGDLLRTELLRERLELVCAFKAGGNTIVNAPPEALNAAELAQRLGEVAGRLGPQLDDTTYLLHDMLRRGEHVLFEGANATLLDVDHGTFPFVTSSSTTALGIPAGTGVPGSAINAVIGVVKAYGTRVGAGPFPTELHDDTGARIRERGNEFGTTTGRPRRCGWLDLVAVRYAAMVNGVHALAIMLLDVLAGFDELKVCTAYELGGVRTDRFPPDAADLSRAKPVYETLEGFAEEVSGARTMDDLPTPARGYLEFIEAYVGVPIRLVSVGADREQTVDGLGELLPG